MDQPTIGDRIAQIRRTRPMTQEALAEAAGVSVETIRKLEQNRSSAARMSTLHRIARALGTPTSHLLGNAARAAAEGAPDADGVALIQLRRALTPARGLRGGRLPLSRSSRPPSTTLPPRSGRSTGHTTWTTTPPRWQAFPS